MQRQPWSEARPGDQSLVLEEAWSALHRIIGLIPLRTEWQSIAWVSDYALPSHLSLVEVVLGGGNVSDSVPTDSADSPSVYRELGLLGAGEELGDVGLFSPGRSFGVLRLYVLHRLDSLGRAWRTQDCVNTRLAVAHRDTEFLFIVLLALNSC